MAEDSTLLLIHGAWCGGWVWEPLLGRLHERGVAVEVSISCRARDVTPISWGIYTMMWSTCARGCRSWGARQCCADTRTPAW